MKLIDKDVLAEKLWERRIKHRDFGGSPHSEYGHEDDEILSLINTLEVKEVDIDTVEELNKYGIQNPKQRDVCIAHHFFELGLKAQKGE